MLREHWTVVANDFSKNNMIKYAFKKFSRWFLKHRATRYILQNGRMKNKKAYLDYKNSVMMHYLKYPEKYVKNNVWVFIFICSATRPSWDHLWRNMWHTYFLSPKKRLLQLIQWKRITDSSLIWEGREVCLVFKSTGLFWRFLWKNYFPYTFPLLLQVFLLIYSFTHLDIYIYCYFKMILSYLYIFIIFIPSLKQPVSGRH